MLTENAMRASVILESCMLCGHGCGANRLVGEPGVCGSSSRVKLAAHLLHFGEEPPISGTTGSGTIFFSNCPLACAFCQNHQISQGSKGEEISIMELAEIMMDLQNMGALNINLVSPTPYVPQIISALDLARDMGLDIPIVYNSGGYDSAEGLAMLNGYVDVFLPDAKYGSNEAAFHYSGIKNYVEVNQEALKEMFRQTGPLTLDEHQAAVRGLIVRHLVLPNGQSQTDQVLSWLKKEFGPDVYISLMAQYFPSWLVKEKPDTYQDISSPLTESQYEAAVQTAIDLELDNVFIQELSSQDVYAPDFDSPVVFKQHP